MNPLCALGSKKAFVVAAFIYLFFLSFSISFNVGLEQKLNLAVGYEGKQLGRQTFLSWVGI
jgi:hypothetical protein